MLAGLFLAFETRKVKIKSLNESRFIAMSVYGAVIVAVTLTPVGFWLQNFPDVQYGIIGIMIMSSTSLILGLIFVTKVSIAKFYQAFPYSHNLHSGTKYTRIQREHRAWITLIVPTIKISVSLILLMIATTRVEYRSLMKKL